MNSLTQKLAILSLSALLPACYASAWPDAECSVRPRCEAGFREVGICAGVDCSLETQCGESIYCERDCDDFVCSDFQSEVPFCDVASPECSLRTSLCGEVYCQDALCNGLPTCEAGEDEVDSCAGEPECHSVSVCGSTIYCAAPCVEPGVCGPDQTAYYDACPPDTLCVEREQCGETIYCAEGPSCESAPPCFDARSSLLDQGPGACPLIPGGSDIVANCYTRNVCGQLHYCVTACNVNDDEVSDPSECPDSCYPAIGADGEVWCRGDVTCDAEPVCGEDEVEMSLSDTCPVDWECRNLTTCGTTIQCGQLLPVPGGRS